MVKIRRYIDKTREKERYVKCKEQEQQRIISGKESIVLDINKTPLTTLSQVKFLKKCNSCNL